MVADFFNIYYMKETYIYTLKDPTTNEIRYVGKTIQKLKSRLNAHIQDSIKSDSNCHKINWINKIVKSGNKPIIEEVDRVSTDWQFWEKYWISQFKSWGFNLTNATEGGGSYIEFKHSVENRKKIRQSKLGSTLSHSHKKEISESIKKISKERPNYNRSGNNVKNIIDKDLLYKLYINENLSIPKISKKIGFSEKKIWQSLQEYNIKKDKSIWKEQLSTQPKKPVLQYNLDGEFIKEWSSPIDIHKELGYNKSNIANVCRGVAKTAHGFIWRYKNEFIELELPQKTKKICQYDKDNNLIKTYESISLTKYDGFSPKCVSSCCNGKTKTHKGFIWKFK